MERHASLLREDRQRTIFIGGGTPTVLTCEQLSRLFDHIDELAVGTPVREVTVEANPGTVTPEKLALLHRRGVTRISMGIQSFSDEVLASLGRLHTAADAVRAFHAAQAAGFRSIGLDLIYGIPGQSERQWLDSLATAVSLRPDHLSVYSLSIDEGSRLSRDAAAGLVRLPDDGASAVQYAAAVDILAASGYQQYEISNFCIPGHACLHNSNYWARGEYLGLGPGAWSSLGNRRTATIADVNEYCSRIAAGSPLLSFEEILDREQVAVETLFLGLRTTEGIDLGRYASLAGAEASDALRRKLRALEGTGLFRSDGSMVRLTTRGMLLSNEAIARIIP